MADKKDPTVRHGKKEDYWPTWCDLIIVGSFFTQSMLFTHFDWSDVQLSFVNQLINHGSWLSSASRSPVYAVVHTFLLIWQLSFVNRVINHTSWLYSACRSPVCMPQKGKTNDTPMHFHSSPGTYHQAVNMVKESDRRASHFKCDWRPSHFGKFWCDWVQHLNDVRIRHICDVFWHVHLYAWYVIFGITLQIPHHYL